MEATRSIEDARRKAHVHLDELAALAPRFENEVLVLMHFSQAASPDQVREAVQPPPSGVARARDDSLRPRGGALVRLRGQT